MESTKRRRPLHTCGVAFLMIAQSAYTRTQDFNGSVTKKLARFNKLASPIICALQYQWLTMLSFSDYCILAIESTVETIFPQSSHVFNKIDELVQFTETLPGKFDDAMNKFTEIKDQGPLLDRAVVIAISWLNFCSTELTRSEEKEIVIVESTSGNQYKESESKGKFPPSPESSSTPPYKEAALEEGSRKENRENKGGNSMEETKKEEEVSVEEEAEKGEKIGIDDEAFEYITRSGDPIMELFESGWLAKPSKEGKGNWLTLSSSYIG